ncbi:MobF family relaxase [Microbacterium sp.]|uniref:MobF family relaxase n=1 Tax=Microbacterium sp. TaxID=51671 RepID=UPI003A838124
MKGGVIPFRGTGAAALHYLESDRSRADDYYLEGGTAIAEFAVVDGNGSVIGEGVLNPDEYAAWVNWINPLTGESMGKPRQAGEGRRGSPRFLEMVVNAPKSLSIAVALHPEVSAALDVAQQDAVAEIRRWLGEHSVTRIGPRGKQEVVPVQQLETVSVVHHTSRAGDPHRHIHFQIGARVWAAGAWRGLDTAALFRQQGAIRALGTAVIAAHPHLAQVLDAHGLTLDPVTGEVAELEPYNALMSKRSAQVQRNLDRFRAEWEAAHPGQEPGPVVRGRLEAMAWDHERPAKKPTTLKDEAAWRTELDAAGYTPDPPRVRRSAPVALDDLSVQQVASRALDRCAAVASTWTVHTVQEHVTRIITESGVRATPDALRDMVAITTRLAAEDCLSVLPPDSVRPEHVAHLTTLHVVAVETNLRDRLTARATARTGQEPDVMRLAHDPGLDPEQAQAAAAVAGTELLVVVEGAAGAGKTTMLGAAIETAAGQGRRTRVVTPTKKAADVAAKELGVAADSVAKLVHEHGWRWNRDGVWTRLAVGDTDPEMGATYTGPTSAARLARGERIVVDEAGMLDQDTALALLTVADEHGATLALVGDRAQLPAVGRGGVLDIAAQLTPRVFDMTTVHRFTDPEYAALTVQMRRGEHPALLFDRLQALGLVVLHESTETVQEAIARDSRDGDAITTATNDEARELNARIRETRVRSGLIDDGRTTTGSDGLSIGPGDVIQTRQNDSDVQVANRQTWTVQAVGQDGAVWAKENSTGRKRQRSVRLPAEYVAEHTHLAYASTAYGVQGATVPASHTVLSGALDASGVYVGMTRGQETNRLHVVAADVDEAREQFVAALDRDRADRGLVAATEAAREAVAGLAADGPVRLVNAERARLTERIERAERQAEKWEQVLTALDRQRKTHWAEADEQQEAVAAADARAAEVRAEVAAPLIEQATAEGAVYLTTRGRMWEAQTAHGQAGRLRKRATGRAAAEAAGEHRTTEDAVRRRWGGLPTGAGGLKSWAEMVAGKQADADPRVTETRQEAERAHREQGRLVDRQMRESIALSQRALGGSTPSRVIAHAAKLRKQADRDRRDLARIEALPVTEAAQLGRELTARAEVAREAAERARAARVARAAQLEPFRPSTGHGRTGPERGGLGM